MRMLESKPIGSQWTDDQWKAIRLTDQNLLIAAAAGSGKTAVLVERIIRRVSSDTHPVDVDRLLVATFTKAAADEMRQRIREALELKLQEKPDSHHIRRQLALIHRASITTLHSFCMEVVQRYFQMIQIDPRFRIGNETEMELMRQDVLEELLEVFYAESENGSDFWRLVDAYSGERSDEALYKLILQLYDYSRSHPWPEHWLTKMADVFEYHREEAEIEESNIWFDSLMKDIQLELSGAISLLKEAIDLAQQPEGPDIYVNTLRDDLLLVEHLYEVSNEYTWEHLYHAFQAIDFPRLKSAKSEFIDKEIQERVKELRDTVKKQLIALKEECFDRSSEQYIEELRETAPLMKKLVEIVLVFSEKYKVAKSAKSLVDFSDLEHYCIEILSHSDSTPDQWVPSQAAIDYQDQFVEVLLDEYQDTNRVQESILHLISKTWPGNRFMVGDVKQSIYRFRLAEPALFLQKYKSYQNDEGEMNPVAEGRKIDLAQNFRSRMEVVDGVNYIFKQMMQESVGEIKYDKKAELLTGARFPEALQDQNEIGNYSIEMLFIDKAASIYDDEESDDLVEGNESDDIDSGEVDLETAQMEARLIASQMKQLLGVGGKMPFQVYDHQAGGSRAIKYRDMVILLRATKHWAPIIMDELKQAGIPCYADLNSGYFSAGEIEIILSLLKIIDNPLQDIALAAVLRSPIVQLTAEDLAQIRIPSKGIPYYEAVLRFVEMEGISEEHSLLTSKLKSFVEQVERWRIQARQGSLSELLWTIYRDTGYYDLVGGLPGGAQRQANLRALYDRTRQYEATSYRGLFRFLRFIERMRDSGGDLGTARALGEQEDVVRIISIHKSKGLEFPIVFIAGLAKMFNRQDLHGHFLLHKELGFGPKFVDAKLQVSYPTLPSLAIKRRMRMEMLAEEMRVLYVALTRAKEKLFLLGTLRDLNKQIQDWSSTLENTQWELPDYALAKATSFLDWLGPALIRHPQAETLRNRVQLTRRNDKLFALEQSKWKITIVPSDGFIQAAATKEEISDQVLEAISKSKPTDHFPTNRQEDVAHKLSWSYPFKQAEQYFSKTSVSEMKRLNSEQKMEEILTGEASETHFLFHNSLLRRPKFMGEKKMTAVERGTLYHAVMQHLTLSEKLVDPRLSSDTIEQNVQSMINKQLISEEQAKWIDASVIETFFASEVGKQLIHSRQVWREIPFSYGIPAKQVYLDVDQQTSSETILIQGVIDCLFETEQGLILLDYKTDAVFGDQVEEIKVRYKLQMELYAKAIEGIWKKPVKEKVLFLFSGAHIVKL